MTRDQVELIEDARDYFAEAWIATGSKPGALADLIARLDDALVDERQPLVVAGQQVWVTEFLGGLIGERPDYDGMARAAVEGRVS